MQHLLVHSLDSATTSFILQMRKKRKVPRSKDYPRKVYNKISAMMPYWMATIGDALTAILSVYVWEGVG